MSEVWPVYKGSSFNLWEPDTGTYYDSVDSVSITAYLQEKRLSQSRTASSAFAELDNAVLDDPKTLPCQKARIVFRNVTRSTDTRTLVTGLIPPNRVITNHAPYLLQTSGSVRDEAYVLGVLCSMPLDWQARRTVELNFTFEQLNSLAIPDPGEGHPVRDRVAELAARLAACDERFADWAAEAGVPVASVAEDSLGGVDAQCELDACVAYLYGLDEDDITVIYNTFGKPGQWDERRDAVLVHYRRIITRQR